MNILVVDDEKEIREIIVDILSDEFKCTIFQAKDGKEAFDIVCSERIDFILTDINMPNMDGLTMVAEIRKLPTYEKNPILVLTTERGDDMKAKGKAAGATGWIVKPFVPDQLLKAVNIVLSKK